ncbi:MAG: hypothetical protein NC131_19020, partial [Roseburia sp.]|nr:hypothetical protein [Roseburia sp.]
MVRHDLEPFVYRLPVEMLNGVNYVLNSKALGYCVEPSTKGYKSACKFWNKHITRFSAYISPTPLAHFSGEINNGLLYLTWHPTKTDDPIPHSLILNPFTGFMCEPSVLDDVDMFTGRQDVLSTLWNLHCGFRTPSYLRKLARENPLPRFSEKNGVVSVAVPTRDLTELNMSLKDFVNRCGIFAEYCCANMEVGFVLRGRGEGEVADMP